MRKEIGKELKKENTMYLVTPPHCSCWASSFHLSFSASSRSLLLFATCQILASPPEYSAAGESVSRRQVQSKVLGWPEPVQGGLSWRRHLARLAYPSVFLYACMFTYNLVCLLHQRYTQSQRSMPCRSERLNRSWSKKNVSPYCSVSSIYKRLLYSCESLSIIARSFCRLCAVLNWFRQSNNAAARQPNISPPSPHFRLLFAPTKQQKPPTCLIYLCAPRLTNLLAQFASKQHNQLRPNQSQNWRLLSDDKLKTRLEMGNNRPRCLWRRQRQPSWKRTRERKHATAN